MQSPSPTLFELINYFLMRMLDKDFHGGDVTTSEMQQKQV